MALVQTQSVIKALSAQQPGAVIETRVITTKGDRNFAPIPLDTVGKAWFTKEIEVALLKGEIDLAVHSYKDLEPELPEGLTAKTVLKRDDPRDVLVAKAGSISLSDLPDGAVIGTDSLRRKASLLRLRPDLRVESVRGNVQTRLRKLFEEDVYDAIVVAGAGMVRLGEEDKISQWFGLEEIVPAAGQGALAVEARSDDDELWKLIDELQVESTVDAIAAESEFTKTIGGGCKLPVGCCMELSDKRANFYAMLGTEDGSRCTVRKQSGPADSARQLAKRVASSLIKTAVT
jgi:hydroxymethylbilane synthase